MAVFAFGEGVVMQAVLGWSHILQILHGIVAFVSIFVVYLTVILGRRRAKKGKSNQAMHEAFLGRQMQR